MSSVATSLSNRLPHTRGGVSPGSGWKAIPCRSSPHTWGCFHPKRGLALHHVVFPTHVGVFPTSRQPTPPDVSLPHTRGGVSTSTLTSGRAGGSSPHTWGCFLLSDCAPSRRKVFPTHVGVFPNMLFRRICALGLPHTRGGVFSSHTARQRRAFHALGHIQQKLRDGQTPRTPDLEKPFQTIPPPGILLGGHAGSPARGRHGFKPCSFRRSGRGQRPPFRYGRRGGHSHLCALPLMSDSSAPPGISTGSILASRRRQGRSPARLKILPPPPL